MTWESAARTLFDRIEGMRGVCPGSTAGEPFPLSGFKKMLVDFFGTREGFYAYRRMLHLPESATVTRLPQRPLHAYALEKGHHLVETAPAGIPYAIPPPTTAGVPPPAGVRGVTRGAYVTRVPNARVFGRSAAIAMDDCVIHDYEAHELPESIMAMDLDLAFLKWSDDEVWLIHTEPSREIPEAFGALLGPLTGHFGDWLSVYLSKYFTALAGGLPPDVPVLVDRHMPARNLEALEVLSRGRCRTIAIDPYETVRVRELWYAPEMRSGPPERWRAAVAQMRDGAADVAPGRAERVFLGRSPQFARHKLVNDGAIEALARDRGFEVVYAERLAFADQIATLKGANYVLGPEGTAMLLNFFASPGTKVCILTNPAVDPLSGAVGIYRELGLDVTIVTGPSVAGGRDPVGAFYDDFAIDERALAAFLDAWL